MNSPAKIAIASAILLMGAGSAFAQANNPSANRGGRVAQQSLVQRLDANKDGAVTFEEYFAATKQRFDQIDANKDGILNGAELDQTRLGKARTLRLYDTNNDGAVSLAELQSAVKRQFDRLDRDGNGTLTELAQNAPLPPNATPGNAPANGPLPPRLRGQNGPGNQGAQNLPPLPRNANPGNPPPNGPLPPNLRGQNGPRNQDAQNNGPNFRPGMPPFQGRQFAQRQDPRAQRQDPRGQNNARRYPRPDPRQCMSPSNRRGPSVGPRGFDPRAFHGQRFNRPAANCFDPRGKGQRHHQRHFDPRRGGGQGGGQGFGRGPGFDGPQNYGRQFNGPGYGPRR